MVSFIFGGDTNETPESIKRKREIANALLASRAPRNVGEGISSIGDGIVAAVMNSRANKAEKSGMESANAAFAPLAAMFSSGASSGVAQEMGATAPGGSPAVATNPNVGSTIDFARAGASGASGAAPADVAGLEGYIREAAQKRGIDPEIAVKVARSEGLAPGVWQSNVVKNGKRETSYGPYQLLVGGGLGDKFQKIYGKSPADPSTVQQQIDFALDEAAQGGWGPWYGAAKVGVGQRTGLERARALGYQQQAQPTEVASLDPSAGMTAPAAIEQQAPIQPPAQPGYVDPKVSAQRAAQPAQPPQQMAQAGGRGGIMDALMAGGAGGTGQGTDYFPPAPKAPQPGELNMQAILGVVNNPFSNPGQRAVAEALIQQEQAKRQAILEQQLQQNDPKYRLDLERGRTELDLMRNPRMDPGEEARIALDREKFGYERNKPMSVTQGETVISPSGEVIFKSDPKPEAKPSAVQEYEYAKEQGFPGTFQDWEASKKGGMSLQVDPATGAVTFQQGGNIKPMTEGQSKDAVFSTRAEGALPLIDQFGDSLTGMEGTVGGTVGQLPVVGNFAKSEGYQQAEQAGKEFLQAILRKDTGAAITNEETNEYGSVYLPRPGDTPATLQQKKVSRRRALEAIKAGMPPQAILAQEKALANTEAAGEVQMPEGMDASIWGAMTPEEKALWK
jgi:hypothetical protein